MDFGTEMRSSFEGCFARMKGRVSPRSVRERDTKGAEGPASPKGGVDSRERNFESSWIVSESRIVRLLAEEVSETAVLELELCDTGLCLLLFVRFSICSFLVS